MNINFLGFTFKKLDKKKSLNNALENLEELIKSSSHVFSLFKIIIFKSIEICWEIILSKIFFSILTWLYKIKVIESLEID